MFIPRHCTGMMCVHVPYLSATCHCLRDDVTCHHFTETYYVSGTCTHTSYIYLQSEYLCISISTGQAPQPIKKALARTYTRTGSLIYTYIGRENLLEKNQQNKPKQNKKPLKPMETSVVKHVHIRTCMHQWTAFSSLCILANF